ncbi:hypothetical protein ONZ45_g5212 [Pleurotus djamor]|nr:hypothetical protein ONZ45_g5212 [Pleurotus djamor]
MSHSPANLASAPNLLANVDNSKMTLTPWAKPMMTIVVIGETGVGKTAFLNLLANTCAGRKPEQFTRVHITSNEAGGSENSSQTNKPTLYQITCANGYRVQVLDTPGLADTRGMDFDNEHKQAISEAISTQITTIDSVIVLANGTNVRLGAATQYALTALAGMFPNSIADNIAFMFTMVSNPLQLNFQSDGLPASLKQAKTFTIDNPLAQWFSYQDALKSGQQDPNFSLEDMRQIVYRSYDSVLNTLNNFFRWQDERTVQPTGAIDDLFRQSTRIESSIMNVITQMTLADNLKVDLTRLQTDIDEQKLIQKVNEQYQTIVDNSHLNTLCRDCNCEMRRDSPAQSSSIYSCEINPRNTGWGNGGGYGWVGNGGGSKGGSRLENEIRIDQAAKAKYDEAKRKEGEKAASKLQIADTLANIQVAMDGYEEDLSDLCAKFNDLALSGSFVGYMTPAIAMLQMRYDTLVQQGAEPDALSRMSASVQSLEKKKKVVEEAMKEREEKLAGSGGFLRERAANIKRVVL